MDSDQPPGNRAAAHVIGAPSRVSVHNPGGIYPVAHPLRLDYMGLKKRLGGIPIRRRKATKPAFVELIGPHATPLEECAIDFECPSGRKMRIQWKASTPPDWVSLLRAWRETEG